MKELEALGVHPSGRKIRTDKGGTHNYIRTDKVRSDKGKVRVNYSNDTAAMHQRHFQTLLNTNSTEGYGDNLHRDANEIFIVNMTSFYKTVSAGPGIRYKTSVTRNTHPENLRWNWWMAEYEEATGDVKQKWLDRICKWYFIDKHDISMWTYSEWAWSYKQAIDGHPNRFVESPIILSYNHYMQGLYGFPEYDDKGGIVWTNLKKD